MIRIIEEISTQDFKIKILDYIKLTNGELEDIGNMVGTHFSSLDIEDVFMKINTLYKFTQELNSSCKKRL